MLAYGGRGGVLDLQRALGVIGRSRRLVAVAPFQPELEVAQRTRVEQLTLRGSQPHPPRLPAAVVAH